jgi:hypothetical protein
VFIVEEKSSFKNSQKGPYFVWMKVQGLKLQKRIVSHRKNVPTWVWKFWEIHHFRLFWKIPKQSWFESLTENAYRWHLEYVQNILSLWKFEHSLKKLMKFEEMTKNLPHCALVDKLKSHSSNLQFWKAERAATSGLAKMYSRILRKSQNIRERLKKSRKKTRY